MSDDLTQMFGTLCRARLGAVDEADALLPSVTLSTKEKLFWLAIHKSERSVLELLLPHVQKFYVRRDWWQLLNNVALKSNAFYNVDTIEVREDGGG
jgi:hypothetical protein